MKNITAQLESYCKEHPIRLDDQETILESLYWLYTESVPADSKNSETVMPGSGNNCISWSRRNMTQSLTLSPSFAPRASRLLFMQEFA